MTREEFREKRLIALHLFLQEAYAECESAEDVIAQGTAFRKIETANRFFRKWGENFWDEKNEGDFENKYKNLSSDEPVFAF